jgi:hypothetical protein
VLEGALILLAGILIGIGFGRLPARRKGPKPAVAVCGCTHHHSMHDPETGECNSEEAVSRYDRYGNWTGKEYKPCACRRYSGPEPLPVFYATEIAGEAGQ